MNIAPNFPRIRIGGIKHSVVFSKPDGDLNERAWGSYNAVKAVITVSADQSPEQMRKTLFHELIHAADILTAGGDGSLTEEQVLALENGLWSIFKDNPGLADAIFQELED